MKKKYVVLLLLLPLLTLLTGCAERGVNINTSPSHRIIHKQTTAQAQIDKNSKKTVIAATVPVKPLEEDSNEDTALKNKIAGFLVAAIAIALFL